MPGDPTPTARAVWNVQKKTAVSGFAENGRFLLRFIANYVLALREGHPIPPRGRNKGQNRIIESLLPAI